ncbi:hypothetical protein B0H13DRAFT_1857769 [Mycena leptocephala]|nr:hypothetical protein B0H13DRAFT_1857769 [Mycena leptocephala]
MRFAINKRDTCGLPAAYKRLRLTNPELPTRWVTLLIQDSPSSPNPLKISQSVPLFVLDTEGCKPGEWRADLRDLLGELQTSNAALTGSLKLAILDPDHPEHRIYFTKVADGVPLNEAPQKYALDVGDPNVKPLEFAQQRHAANNAAVAKAGSSSSKAETDADAEWLAAEVKTLPGYSKFDVHRHKVQQNTGVVASWKFIALVSETYFVRPSHIPPSLMADGQLPVRAYRRCEVLRVIPACRGTPYKKDTPAPAIRTPGIEAEFLAPETHSVESIHEKRVCTTTSGVFSPFKI